MATKVTSKQQEQKTAEEGKSLQALIQVAKQMVTTMEQHFGVKVDGADELKTHADVHALIGKCKSAAAAKVAEQMASMEAEDDADGQGADEQEEEEGADTSDDPFSSDPVLARLKTMRLIAQQELQRNTADAVQQEEERDEAGQGSQQDKGDKSASEKIEA
jgi:hypothetical protein